MKRSTMPGGPFVVALTNLRSHLRKCKECKVVARGAGYGPMCEEGIMLTHQMVYASNNLASQHGKAHKLGSGMIYPCPDVTAHGKAYSSTAQPHIASAVQEELF